MRVGGISPSQIIMEKLTKTLLILNLLHHRHVVSAAEIKKICRISNRSLYRYLNAISAAHFPIIFDRKLRGYRLIEKDDLNISSIKLDERLIILVALTMLSKRVNLSYSECITTICGKIISSSFKGMEEVWHAFSGELSALASNQDLSGMVTSLIIHSAARSGKNLGVNISFAGKDGDFMVVEKPSLLFSDGWKITGKGIEKAVSLDSVEQVFSY